MKKTENIKRINIKEFREKGYLQEINRRFLHPLGLALEIVLDDETDEEKLGGIWDYREDEEGIYYDIKNSDNNRIDKFKKNKIFIDSELERRNKRRNVELGFDIEEIPLNPKRQQKICNEHQIALKIINTHIDTESDFTYDEITKEIIEEGGILRTSIGITIRMYLKNLKEIGILIFDEKSEQFKVNKNALMDHHLMDHHRVLSKLKEYKYK